MTEAQWTAFADPTAMLGFLKRRSGARKRRLFAVASCRTVWANFPNDRCREAVDAAERFADGLIGEDELDAARDGAYRMEGLARGQDFQGAAWARVAAEAALVPVIVPQLRGTAYLLRDIFGNPFRPVVADPAWLTSTAVGVARAVYDGRAFGDLPILADALQDAGCDDADILAHCRGGGSHVRGCWVVDSVLGKD